MQATPDLAPAPARVGGLIANAGAGAVRAKHAAVESERRIHPKVFVRCGKRGIETYPRKGTRRYTSSSLVIRFSVVRTYAPVGQTPVLGEWWTWGYLSTISALSLRDTKPMVKRSDNLEQNGYAFEAASVILPVINETHSLLKTIEIIDGDCTPDVQEYLIVVCNKTTRISMQLCEQLHDKNPQRFLLHHQKLPFLGGAIREAFDLAQGSHVVMMASDLETDPYDVRQLIAMAKEKPTAIITASRWLRGGDFTGYKMLKLMLNCIFQKFFSIIFTTRLSDMTYGYRIFPTPLVKSIGWEELRHPFLFETLIKPLRLGVPVYEIPSRWVARVEGASQNTFMRNFAYFKTGLSVRFCRRDKILKPLAQEEQASRVS